MACIRAPITTMYLRRAVVQILPQKRSPTRKDLDCILTIPSDSKNCCSSSETYDSSRVREKKRSIQKLFVVAIIRVRRVWKGNICWLQRIISPILLTMWPLWPQQEENHKKNSPFKEFCANPEIKITKWRQPYRIRDNIAPRRTLFRNQRIFAPHFAPPRSTNQIGGFYHFIWRGEGEETNHLWLIINR